MHPNPVISAFVDASNWLSQYSINLPATIAFAAAALVGIQPSNAIIKGRLKSRIDDLAKQKDESVTAADLEAIRTEFDLPLAGSIGALERTLYIYAILTNSLGVLTGWVVMKAFFSWLKPNDHKVTSKYHLYLLGNGLSLAIGIGLGVLAKIIEANLWRL